MVSIHKTDGILHKLVFEVRYRFGFTYLDRCGRFINRVMKEMPEWVLASDVSPQGAPLVSLKNGTRFSFGSYKYDFSLEQQAGGDALAARDVNAFRDQVGFAGKLLQDEMALTEFTRVGFRVWYLFHANSKPHSEQIIRECGFFATSPSVAPAFGGDVEAQSHTVIIKSPDRSYRISINGVERQMQVDLGEAALSLKPRTLSSGQKEALLAKMKATKRVKANPEFAMMIDIDAFIDDPHDIDHRDFIERSMAFIEEGLPKAFRKTA